MSDSLQEKDQINQVHRSQLLVYLEILHTALSPLWPQGDQQQFLQIHHQSNKIINHQSKEHSILQSHGLSISQQKVT